MRFTTEELKQILKEIGSSGRVDLNCTYCGKITNKRARYIREAINKSVDGLCNIFCSHVCHNKYKKYTNTTCGNCGKDLYVLRSRLEASESGFAFCSSSCAATYNNTRRIRSEDSRRKVSESLRKFYGTLSEYRLSREFVEKICKNCNGTFRTSRLDKIYCSEECRLESGASKRLALRRTRSTKTGEYNKLSCPIEFSYCPICKTPFMSKGNKILRKYCSKPCSLKAASIRQSEWLSKAENRSNLGRHKRSYPEEAFIKWLDINKINYRFEPKFENTHERKYYFPDFVFDDIKLIIELDGTQHRKTIEKDRARDEYITKEYGYVVKRYWCKDFLKGTHYEEICSLLNVVVDLSKQT